MYDIVGCLIMPPSPLSLALAVQAKATRLAAATVMPPASRTVLRIALRLSRVIGPTAGPGRPVADAQYDDDERMRMPASRRSAGWLVEIVSTTWRTLPQVPPVSVAPAASGALARIARARPLSLAPHPFDRRRSWTEPSPEGIDSEITTDSAGRIKNNRS
jgi:hypothetical protein